MNRKQQKEFFNVLTKNVDDWSFSNHHATHTPSKAIMWISNGIESFDNKGAIRILLGIRYKIKLWKWLKYAQSVQIMRAAFNSDLKKGLSNTLNDNHESK